MQPKRHLADHALSPDVQSTVPVELCLKECRLGPKWAVKDESGAYWDVTPKQEKAEEAAARRAKPTGLRAVVCDELGVER